MRISSPAPAESQLPGYPPHTYDYIILIFIHNLYITNKKREGKA